MPATATLHWSGQTDRGRVRANNEDTFLALTFDAEQVHYLGKVGQGDLGSMDYVFAVSDGMGGAMAGEFASRITVEKVTRLLPRGFRSRAAGLDVGFADLFAELFGEIHKALSLLGSTYPECAGMGATLSLCWFAPGWMYFAHLGDSRIYYLPAAGGMKPLTHDHTQVGWMVRQGKMSEREARSHPQRNSLLRALGAGHQFVDPQVGAVGLEPGDRFLLCTDGLTDGLWDRQLEALLRSPDPAEASLLPSVRLVQASVERSGRDNTTALVVEVA
jgi:protein phosphatase